MQHFFIEFFYDFWWKFVFILFPNHQCLLIPEILISECQIIVDLADGMFIELLQEPHAIIGLHVILDELQIFKQMLTKISPSLTRILGNRSEVLLYRLGSRRQLRRKIKQTSSDKNQGLDDKPDVSSPKSQFLKNYSTIFSTLGIPFSLQLNLISIPSLAMILFFFHQPFSPSFYYSFFLAQKLTGVVVLGNLPLSRHKYLNYAIIATILTLQIGVPLNSIYSLGVELFELLAFLYMSQTRLSKEEAKNFTEDDMKVFDDIMKLKMMLYMFLTMICTIRVGYFLEVVKMEKQIERINEENKKRFHEII